MTVRTVAVLLVLLAGCAHTSVLDLFVGKIEGPPPFKDGYRAGCASGLRAGGMAQMDFTKDVTRYNAERLYAQGWEDGYSVCRTRALG